MAAETISPDAPRADAPAGGGVAERYALALLALADDKRQADPGALDRIAADLEALFALYRDDAAFRAFVGDPRLSAADQKRALFALLEKAGAGVEIRNFVGVLIANRRLSALPAIAAAFAAKLAERRGQQVAHVTTAFPLTDTQRAQIAARLTEAGFSGVKLSETVDRAILGGLIVRIGSRLYDNSIKSKLQRLQYAMKGAA
ncbi:MAG: ATP synthase F1 subunit delta [Roseococcus sp.]